MKHVTTLILSAALLTGLQLATPNDVQAQRYVVPVESGYAGWTPLYYDGYLVYFDTAGRPYYYPGGRATYVPRHWNQYTTAVSRFRTHGRFYNRWYQRYGHQQYRVRVIVPTPPPPPPQPVVVEPVYEEPIAIEDEYSGWTPEYYDGYLVYFDDNGTPYYYTNGSTVYVPRTWDGYTRVVTRYRSHGANYRNWHKRYNQPRYRVRVRHSRPAPSRPAVVRPTPSRPVHSPMGHDRRHDRRDDRRDRRGR
ncbi:MAG: hypothetical protein CVU59_02575 [Deltaproteobacteria bacterium HGW-Deltaproteobacteria-17]|nr:MAG: hypothetical protein CVU59_02575 [Deltaproteobacteria bacterium HGW-Deltaproteobacteria-17]